MNVSPERASPWWAVALVVLLLLRAGLGLAYSLATPLGEAPDEADHFAYAAYILEKGALPIGPEMTQGKHPPLYHILAAAAGRFAGGTGDRSFLRANPDMAFGPGSRANNFFVHTTADDWPWRGGVLTMRAGRFVSMLAGLVLVLATYLLGRAIWPHRPDLALMAAAFAAFLPESLFIGGVMSNDMLAAMWTTLALWLATLSGGQRREGRPGALLALAAGACSGLAFVTKASTGALALIVAAVLFIGALPATARPRAAIQVVPGVIRVALAGAAAFLIAAPWLWRNWRLYGDLAGWPIVLATIDRRKGLLGPGDVALLLRGWWLSFWGKFGGAGHIALPAPFYVVWALLGILAVAGWVAWLVRRPREDGLVRRTGLTGWMVLLGTPLVTAAAIYSYSQTALGTDQGRLLFPALGPLALLIAGGIAGWLPARSSRLASVLFAGGMALVAVAALAGLAAAYTAPPAPSPERVAAARPINAAFGPLELVASAWDEPGAGELTLYWRTVQRAPEDLRTALRLYDADGNLLWEWKRSPGAGRISTDRWSPGQIVADIYRIPPEALARLHRAEVGIRPFPEGAWVQPAGQDNGPFVTIPR